MTYQHFETVPISGALGAEIRGLSLSEGLDVTVVTEIRQALLNHLVIFFRDQALSPEQQISFARSMGPLEEHDFVRGLPEHLEIIRVVREADEAQGREEEALRWVPRERASLAGELVVVVVVVVVVGVVVVDVVGVVVVGVALPPPSASSLSPQPMRPPRQSLVGSPVCSVTHVSGLHRPNVFLYDWLGLSTKE